MTPTGIEPVLPPWKGDVLTAWPRSRSIIRINKNYELPDKKTPRVGLEPTTARLTAACSTNWAIEEYEIYNKTTYLIRHLYHMHCMWIPSKLHTDFRFLRKWSSQFRFAPFRWFAPQISSRIKNQFRKHASFTASSPALPLSTLWSSPRSISNSQLHMLPCFHLCPIYLVLFKGSYFLMEGISHLEGGFTLRCLQRLSLPDLATLPCRWSTTDTPVVRPSRSSRTKDSSSQISSARAG